MTTKDALGAMKARRDVLEARLEELNECIWALEDAADDGPLPVSPSSDEDTENRNEKATAKRAVKDAARGLIQKCFEERGQLSRADLLQATGVSKSVMTANLARLVADGLLKRVSRGIYRRVAED